MLMKCNMPYMYPHEIRYSQDSISSCFSDKPGFKKKRIGQTLDDICNYRCSVHDIPTISVCQPTLIARCLGVWVSADNRRLWVFKHVQRLGKCDKIFVKEVRTIPAWKLVGPVGRMMVRVRGDPGGYWHTVNEGLILNVKRLFRNIDDIWWAGKTILKYSPLFGLLYLCLPKSLLISMFSSVLVGILLFIS